MTQHSQLTDDENRKLRERVREQLEKRGHNGQPMSAREAALKMGIHPNTMASFLRGDIGAGATLLAGFEKLFGWSRLQMLVDPAAVMEAAATSGKAPKARRYDQMAWWPVLLAEAKRVAEEQLEQVPDYAYSLVGEMSSPDPPRLSPLDLVTFAKLMHRSSTVRDRHSPIVSAARHRASEASRKNDSSSTKPAKKAR